jgi:hypothetical protein
VISSIEAAVSLTADTSDSVSAVTDRTDAAISTMDVLTCCAVAVMSCVRLLTLWIDALSQE